MKYLFILCLFFHLALFPSKATGAFEEEGLPAGIEKDISSLETSSAVIMDVRSGDLEFGWDYISNSTEHIYEVVKKPLHWNAREWLILGTFVAVVAAGQDALDDDVREFAVDERHRNKTLDDLSVFGEAFGNGLYMVPGMGIAYLLGQYTEDNRLKRVALIGLESRIATDVLTTLMKVTANRDRPGHDTKSSGWHGLFGSEDPRFDAAFPSGHTATAFSLATVIALEYDDQPVTQFLAYTAATMTGLSRIYDDKHWATDVVAGAAIGYFTTKAIYSFHTDEEVSDTPVVYVVPTVGASRREASVGLSLTVRF